MHWPNRRHGAAYLVAAFAAFQASAPAEANEPLPPQSTALARLLAAYPDVLERIDGNELVWRDGTRMAIDDGQSSPAADGEPDRASIKDMLAEHYPAGAPLDPPPPGADPGRARSAAFFIKLYGECAKGGVAPHLVSVPWVPAHSAHTVKMTALHGAAAHLKAVSARLDTLPASLIAYLAPAGGTYSCRTISGTGRRSAHGFGIAIDIAVKHAHYWRWSKPAQAGLPIYRNEIPAEIVRAFEAEGFIWGGRWSHYDTMHFEYRPELFPPPVKGGRAQ